MANSGTSSYGGEKKNNQGRNEAYSQSGEVLSKIYISILCRNVKKDDHKDCLKRARIIKLLPSRFCE